MAFDKKEYARKYARERGKSGGWCRFNDAVNCPQIDRKDPEKCTRCGWNPLVAKERSGS